MENKILDMHAVQTEMSQGIVRRDSALESSERTIAHMQVLRYVIMTGSMGFSLLQQETLQSKTRRMESMEELGMGG